MSDAPPGALRASAVSAACFLRTAPLFFRSVPKTPLRVLGLVALDTLHVLRRSQWLPRERIEQLALFFDFAGLTNAAFDHKGVSEAEYRAVHQRLQQAGLGSAIATYVGNLEALEGHRPPVGGDGQRFEDVQAYREAVARLSLETAVRIAMPPRRLGDHRRSGVEDGDVETLLRILMQCQIIDDVLDYRTDMAFGLPSFVTACTPLPRAMALTADAARRYASAPAGHGVLPLRVALRVVTVITRIVIGVAGPRPRNARQFAQ